MGKYDTGNPYFAALSQNNPYYDYHVEYFDKKYNDRYNRYNLSGHFAAGISMKMSERVQFKSQVFTNIGFTDVTAKDFRNKEYVNVTGISSKYEKTKVLAYGLSMGLIIHLGEL
jgi:hypothetical protein